MTNMNVMWHSLLTWLLSIGYLIVGFTTKFANDICIQNTTNRIPIFVWSFVMSILMIFSYIINNVAKKFVMRTIIITGPEKNFVFSLANIHMIITFICCICGNFILNNSCTTNESTYIFGVILVCFTYIQNTLNVAYIISYIRDNEYKFLEHTINYLKNENNILKMRSQIGTSLLIDDDLERMENYYENIIGKLCRNMQILKNLSENLLEKIPNNQKIAKFVHDTFNSLNMEEMQEINNASGSDSVKPDDI